MKTGIEVGKTYIIYPAGGKEAPRKGKVLDVSKDFVKIEGMNKKILVIMKSQVLMYEEVE